MKENKNWGKERKVFGNIGECVEKVKMKKEKQKYLVIVKSFQNFGISPVSEDNTYLSSNFNFNILRKRNTFFHLKLFENGNFGFWPTLTHKGLTGTFMKKITASSLHLSMFIYMRDYIIKFDA